MRKVFVFVMVCMAVLAGCQKVDLNDVVSEQQSENGQKKAFVFHVKGDFQTCYEEMTRAAVRLENDNTAGVTDLWVLDYGPSPTSTEGEGVLLQVVHQSSTDEGFGTVAMELTYGHHDVKFIASKGTSPALTANSLSWQKAHDTFVLDYPVDVVASSNGNRAPELKRAVSCIKLLMTDAVPQNAKEIQVTAKRSLSLALPSLAAAALSETTVTMQFTDNWKGTKNNAAMTYTLCPEDEFTTDVHVKVVATDGSTISEFTINDVEIRKNRITTLKGEVFNRTNGFQVSVDNVWDEPLEVEF